MSIIREYGKYISVCDVCFEQLPEKDSYQEAINSQKDAGWKNVKIDDEWNSVCPDCIETDYRGEG